MLPTTAFTLRELARHTHLAHTSLRTHLDALQKEGIITTTKRRQGTRVFPTYAASGSQQFTRHKRQLNVLLLQDSGLLEHLRDTFFPTCIVLFGSYERGEDTPESDIDLFVEAQTKPIDLHRYEKILQRPVQLHIRPEFRRLPKELKNNIINGTTLSGFLEVF